MTDVEGTAELARDYGQFKQLLADLSGVNFELFPVASRAAAIAGIERGKADFFLLGPTEYILLRSRLPGMRSLAFIERQDYRSIILVRDTAAIHRTEDLKGKRIALGEFGSTSKHLGPLMMVIGAGLAPDKDLDIVVSTPMGAWRALKSNQVDAMGTRLEIAMTLLTRGGAEPEGEKLRVLAIGEPLPPDVIACAPNVPVEICNRVQAVLLGSSSEVIGAILHGRGNSRFSGSRLVAGNEAQDYSRLEEAIGVAGFRGAADQP